MNLCNELSNSFNSCDSLPEHHFYSLSDKSNLDIELFESRGEIDRLKGIVYIILSHPQNKPQCASEEKENQNKVCTSRLENRCIQ